jgi:hypothetical protein
METKKTLESAKKLAKLMTPKQDKTALQEFADWLKDVDKYEKIEITKGPRAIVFVRSDFKENKE